MTETATRNQRSVEPWRTDGRHLRNYNLIGTVILIGLALVAIAAAIVIVANDRGSADPQLNAAFYGLVFVCVLLSVGLLYVLFTLRGMLRMVREQAAELARMNVRPQPVAAPREPIEYHAPAGSSRDVRVIEGIGDVFARRLARSGIETLRDLRAADAPTIAKGAKAPLSVSERWKSMADLMAAPGIDAQAAEILVACDVRTLDELASQSAAALHRKATKANASGGNRIVPASITKTRVNEWIEAAREFDGTPSFTPQRVAEEEEDEPTVLRPVPAPA